MAAGRWAGTASAPQLGYVGNSAAPQLSDWGRAAGHALIFAAALASGQVDDSRLTWGAHQAHLHDQSATRAVWPSLRLRSTGSPPPPFFFVPQQEYRDPPSSLFPISRLRSTGPPLTTFVVPQQEYRDPPSQIFPIARLRSTGPPLKSFFIPQQAYVDIQPQVWASARASLIPSVPATFVRVPPQEDYRPPPQIWAAAIASGAVDDSRLTWSSQEAQLYDRSATRAIWPSALPPPAPSGSVATVSAAPQLADLTQQPVYFRPQPAPQGRVPPSVLVPQQEYRDPPSYVRSPTPASQGPVPPAVLVPQQEYRDPPSYVRAPNPAPQGKLGASIIVPQQEYRDPPSYVKWPMTTPQGKVPATIQIPQQEYRDPPSYIKTPQPAAQGGVPALLTVPPQADPSQLAPVIWRSATATIVVPNPAAPFFFIAEQEQRYIAANIWPSTRASSYVAPAQISAGPQIEQTYEQGITRVVWSPAISPPVAGVLPFPYVWVAEQSDVLQALAAQLQPTVWPAIQIGIPPIINPPVIVLPTGGGGGFHPKGKKHRKHKHIDLILRDVEAIYAELTGTPRRQVAAAIIRPYAATRAKVPRPPSVDWAALDRDAQTKAALIALWNEHQIELDDEEILTLLGG